MQKSGKSPCKVVENGAKSWKMLESETNFAMEREGSLRAGVLRDLLVGGFKV